MGKLMKMEWPQETILSTFIQMAKLLYEDPFFDTYMIDAKYVDVLEYAYDEYGILYAKTFTKPLNNYTYQYDPPTNISFGGGNTNLIPDPYEMEMVKMAPSSIPESGDGVFLRKAVKSLTIVAYFSTYLFR